MKSTTGRGAVLISPLKNIELQKLLRCKLNTYLMLVHTHLGTSSLQIGFEAMVCCGEYVQGDQMIIYGGMMSCLIHLEDFEDKQG